MEKYIYHIVDASLNPNTILEKEAYVPEGFAKENFIHCSEKQQVGRTLNKWFEGKDSVHLFKIQTNRVSSPVVFEDLTNSGEDFPHIYGALNTDAVVETTFLERNEKGSFEFE